MWFRVEYIRKFLHTINKSTLNLYNTDLSIIHAALGYNVLFKLNNGTPENTSQVFGIYNKNYLTKSTAQYSTVGQYVKLFSGKLPVLLHKIQWESDIPLMARVYVSKCYNDSNSIIHCLTHTTSPTHSMYFKHPLPLYLFEESRSVYRIEIKFTPTRPQKLHLFTSILQIPLNPKRVYYWADALPVNLHSLQIAPSRHNDGYNITSNKHSHTSYCRCAHFHVHNKNTLAKYSIPEHLLR